MGRIRAIGARDWDQVTIRLPPGLRDLINKIAAKNGRSANAEIVARLEASFNPESDPAMAMLRTVIREEVARALGLHAPAAPKPQKQRSKHP